jgi:hypothetical protein
MWLTILPKIRTDLRPSKSPDENPAAERVVGIGSGESAAPDAKELAAGSSFSAG